MKNIMRTIIHRPVLAIIFFIVIILLGFYSYKNMPIERIPQLDEGLPQLSISYRWQNASPDMLLQRVLIPAEGEVTAMKGIQKLSSQAYHNYGYIAVEFSRDTRMNFAEVEMRERLNRIQRDFPRQVSPPRIYSRVPREFRQRPLFRIGLYAEGYSVYSIRNIAQKEIIPHLKAIPGIEAVDLFGGVEPEIKIRTDSSRLKRFNLTIFDIQNALRENFYNLSSLSLTKNQGEIALDLSENPDKIKDIQDIVVRHMRDTKIFLKNVADVFHGYQQLTAERRYQGKAYVQLELEKEPNRSHMEVAQKVRAKLRYLTQRLDEPIEFVIQYDDSKILSKQLVKLAKIAFAILLIIFVILLAIIRDIKASLLIFSSVFFSVFATLTVIYLFEIPLNMLTLSGLALGFGLFVDNAVVVFDSILRLRERGKDMIDAAAEGAQAVIMPVLASTFTTIIVFFSFAMLFKDRLRVYYLPLAYVIAVSLLSSIAVSFILIPSLSARIKIRVKKYKNGKQLFKRGRVFPFILKYPLVVLLPILILLGSSYMTFKKEVSFGRFFGFNMGQSVDVSLYFPDGTEFEEVKQEILKFEELALAKSFKKEINTAISRTSAQMTVTFPPEVEATAYPLQLKQELVGLATNLAGIGVSIYGIDQEGYSYFPGTGSSLPFNIRVTGYNLEKLLEYSGEVKRTLLRHKRIKEAAIQTDLSRYRRGSLKYYSFRLLRDKMKVYNLTPRFLTYLLSTIQRESTGEFQLKFNHKETGVEIKTAGVDQLELDDVLNQSHISPAGTPFRLRDVVEIRMVTQKGGISRENQEFKAMVQWDYLGSAKSGDRFHKTLYDKLAVPPGFKKSLEKFSFYLTEEEETQLNTAIILSLFLIFLVLGILYENFFQPLLIMLSIPLALIGVFIAFIVMGFSFDSTAYIGVILLSGIVVNNAIILIDNINRHLAATGKIVESIITGTKERIRPIFMTTMTTVLGMLPMVLFRESASRTDIWSSLALCTVGGLTTSALLILLVLPIFYYLFYRLQRHLFSSQKAVPSATRGLF